MVVKLDSMENEGLQGHTRDVLVNRESTRVRGRCESGRHVEARGVG